MQERGLDEKNGLGKREGLITGVVRDKREPEGQEHELK